MSGREPPTSSPFPGPVSRPGNRGGVGVAEKGVWKVSLGPGEGGVGGGAVVVPRDPGADPSPGLGGRYAGEVSERGHRDE